jgi:hypothetical protein
MRRYEDAGLQIADAVLAHLAERESIRTVFTLDRRDFAIIRLKRNRTLKLLPDVCRSRRVRRTGQKIALASANPLAPLQSRTALEVNGQPAKTSQQASHFLSRSSPSL